MITIYHNTRCSKSRESLALVQDFAAARNLPLNIIDYLVTPPGAEELAALQRQLGVPAREMVRDNEAEFAELNLAQADDNALLQAVAAHPRLLQRPIVVYQGRAMIGRPPERLHELLRKE
jgi:arsenate reductase (glutaredoxin)